MIDWTQTVETTPQLRRGQVWCCECGRSMRVNSAQCLSSGWPKCCGYTMTLDSPAERAKMEEKEKDGRTNTRTEMR